MNTQTIILCVVIFLCRIVDVSCGTLRMVLTVREKTLIAALVGFLEVFIWFMIVRQALSSAGNGYIIAIAYAGGYAAGTYIGGRIARVLITSDVVMEVVTSGKNDETVKAIQDAGFIVTVVDTHATAFGPGKYLLLSEISSRRLKEYKDLVYSLDSAAFILVQETKYVFHGFIRKGK